MTRAMTMKQIKARYKSEWVLLGDPVTDEHLEVKGGAVLFHSKRREEISRKMKEFRPGRSAVLYTGPIAKEMGFIL